MIQLLLINGADGSKEAMEKVDVLLFGGADATAAQRARLSDNIAITTEEYTRLNSIEDEDEAMATGRDERNVAGLSLDEVMPAYSANMVGSDEAAEWDDASVFPSDDEVVPSSIIVGSDEAAEGRASICIGSGCGGLAGQSDLPKPESSSCQADFKEESPLNTLSILQVSELLHKLNLGKYAAQFVDAPVDGATLVECTEEDFAQLGVSFAPHRRKLYRYVQVRLECLGRKKIKEAYSI